MQRSNSFHTPFRTILALLLCCVLSAGTVTAAFAEDESPAATDIVSTTEENELPVIPEESTTGKSEDTTGTTKEEEETTKPEEDTTKPAEEEPAKPDFSDDYTGIANTTYEGEKAWWRVENGEVKPNAKGVYKNEYGWWYVNQGKVDFDYTGIQNNDYGWWRIVNGKVDFNANGIYKNEYGWWKVENGKVNFKYTGVAKNEYGWWRVEKGKVNFKATGVYANEYGRWYVKNGKVDFSKTGTVTIGKISYTVQKGKVTGVTIKVPLVNQSPKYPTGCEAASATMLLKYYGYSITLDQMVSAIPRENIRTVNGKRYGPKITEKFVGDPRCTYTSSTPGYGAFAPVVTKSLNSVIQKRGGSHKAVNKTGASLSDLFDYVAEGHPVIVWSTYNMKTPTTVNSWYIDNGKGGYELFSYPRGTHVCVLVGYDGSNVYLNDPYGATTKSFSRSAFQSKYKLLGNQAILLQ